MPELYDLRVGLQSYPPAVQETVVRFLSREDPLEKGKATHSAILAWRVPCTILSVGLQRVGHDGRTFTSTFKGRRFPGGPVV